MKKISNILTACFFWVCGHSALWGADPAPVASWLARLANIESISVEAKCTGEGPDFKHASGASANSFYWHAINESDSSDWVHVVFADNETFACRGFNRRAMMGSGFRPNDAGVISTCLPYALYLRPFFNNFDPTSPPLLGSQLEKSFLETLAKSKINNGEKGILNVDLPDSKRKDVPVRHSVEMAVEPVRILKHSVTYGPPKEGYEVVTFGDFKEVPSKNGLISFPSHIEFRAKLPGWKKEEKIIYQISKLSCGKMDPSQLEFDPVTLGCKTIVDLDLKQSFPLKP